MKKFMTTAALLATILAATSVEAQAPRQLPKRSPQSKPASPAQGVPGRVNRREPVPTSNMSFSGERVRRDRLIVDRRPNWSKPSRPTRPSPDVNIQQNNQTNVVNQSGVGNTVNIQNVQNIVNNVTNVTNINNQQVNNTVVNNFRGPTNYVNNYQRPWRGRYDYVHNHWHGSGSYWNFRYRPSIWFNPATGPVFGIGPVVTYNFVNPYWSPTSVTYFSGYDYSQPIRPLNNIDQSGRVTEEAIRRLDAARAAFRQQDYRRALDLVEGAIRLLPDDPVMHEFRALSLFAMREYDAAATVIYSVLGAGPGSDWSSIGSLYDNQEIYLAQLRDLSQYVARIPDRPGSRFLLAYHLLVVGYPEAAYNQLVAVQRMRPDDRVTAEILRALQQQSQ